MILGIDPGLSGALAFYWPELDEIEAVVAECGISRGAQELRHVSSDAQRQR